MVPCLVALRGGCGIAAVINSMDREKSKPTVRFQRSTQYTYMPDPRAFRPSRLAPDTVGTTCTVQHCDPRPGGALLAGKITQRPRGIGENIRKAGLEIGTTLSLERSLWVSFALP